MKSKYIRELIEDIIFKHSFHYLWKECDQNILDLVTNKIRIKSSISDQQVRNIVHEHIHIR